MNMALSTSFTSFTCQQPQDEPLFRNKEVRNMNHQANQQKHYGFAQIPRITLRGTHYKLSLIEKGLYSCLKDICGEAGECFYSLRNLAMEIATSISTLSRYIPQLRDKGLIYAEKKCKQNGHEVWYIRIVNIWAENDALYKLSVVSSDNPDCFSVKQSSTKTPSIVTDRNSFVTDRNDQDTNQARDCFYLRANEYGNDNQRNDNQRNDSGGVSSSTTTPRVSSFFDGENDHEEAPPSQGEKPKRGTRRGSKSSTTTSEKPKRGKKSGTTEKPRASQVEKPNNPIIILTQEEQAFYDLYCQMPWVAIKPKLSEGTKDMCGKFAPHLKTKEDILDLQKHMRKDKFLAKKGMSFGVMTLGLNDWLANKISPPEIEETPPPPPTRSRPSRPANAQRDMSPPEETNNGPDQLSPEKQAKLAAIKATLMAQTQSSIQQKGI